jgi:hypothetical protein
MTQSRQRLALRWSHLAASVLLGAFIYSPLRDNPVLLAAVQYAAFPGLALSGLWMWQQGRIARLLRARAV